MDLSLLTTEEKNEILFHYFLANNGETFIKNNYASYATCEFAVNDIVLYQDKTRIGIIRKVKLNGRIRIKSLALSVESATKEQFDSQEITMKFYKECDEYWEGDRDYPSDQLIKLENIFVFSYHDTFNNGKKKKSIIYAFAAEKELIAKNTEILEIKPAKISAKKTAY